MKEYLQQYERVKRFLARLTNQNRSQMEYEDDIWAFFQNCWHLKDWIKNDPTIPVKIRNSIEDEVNHVKSLMIAADLANRSKHYSLIPKRRGKHSINRLDAKVTKKSLIINVPTIYMNLKSGESSSIGEVSSEYHYTITTEDRTEYDALQAAKDTIEDWNKVIKKLGI